MCGLFSWQLCNIWQAEVDPCSRHMHHSSFVALSATNLPSPYCGLTVLLPPNQQYSHAYCLQVFSLTGVSCWRCGKRGHLTKDCSQPDARPCVYCARYGHEGADCPDSKFVRLGQTHAVCFSGAFSLSSNSTCSPQASSACLLYSSGSGAHGACKHAAARQNTARNK